MDISNRCTDVNELLSALPEYHRRFQLNPEDSDNFIKYVNTLIYLRKKSIGSDSSSSSSYLAISPPIPPSPPHSTGKIKKLEDVFIYIDVLKKSPNVASDFFEISFHNPMLFPTAHRVDHYNPVTVPRFNQAVYYAPNANGSTLYGNVNNNNNIPTTTITATTTSTTSTTTTTTTNTTINTAINSYGNNNNNSNDNNKSNYGNNNNNSNLSTNRDRSQSAPVTIGSSSLLSVALSSTTSVTNSVNIKTTGDNKVEVNGLGSSQLSILPNLSNFQIGTSPPLSSQFLPTHSINIKNININNNNNSFVNSINNKNNGNSTSSLYVDDNYNPDEYLDDNNENEDDNSNNNNSNNKNNLINIKVNHFSDSCGDLHFEKLSTSDLEAIRAKYANSTLTETMNIASKEPKVRNWSLEFWNALQMDHNCGTESLKRSQKIQSIAKEFVEVATKHGVTIIQEKQLSKGWTIPPHDAGGIAGGLKYLKDGIFFKFAVDAFGIYGGDAFAMKSAGHELKGLMAYFNCQIDGLFLPMMTLIDYMGYRLIATSQLNIEADKTLVYGSNDGGETVRNNSLEMEDKMKKAAEILNLKGHLTGQSENKTFLYGPCDIEGHITKDKHFVVIDTARVFPPEKPIEGKRGSHLYTLLRPELVRSSKVPLSSDAFTKFGGSDSDVNNEEVERSQKRLLNHVIPSFVLLMNQRTKKTKCKNIMELSHNLMLIDSMHREGINVRYLQRLKKTDIHALDQRLSTIINTEIIARKIKNRLRSHFRSTPLIDGQPDLDSICKFLNRMITISLLQSCDLDGFSLELLLHRISQMTGISFKKDDTYKKFEHSESLKVSDIDEIKPKVKFLHMVPYQQGVALFHQAISLSKTNDIQTDNTFHLASEKFKLAIQSKPDDYEILTHWGILLSMRAKFLSETKDYIKVHGKAEIEKLYQIAIDKFHLAVKIKRNHHYALYNWADALRNWASIKSGSDSTELEKKAKMKLKEAGVFEKKWFFGTLETGGAASLLSGKEAGSFIIRNSNSRPGSFVFSYLSDPHRKILHSIIKSSSNGYHVENLPPRKISSSTTSSPARSGSSQNLTELASLSLSSSTTSLSSSTSSTSSTSSSSSIPRVGSSNNLNKNQEIVFNEASTTTPTSRNLNSLSQTSSNKTLSYKTLEEFVIEKIKQGYIPITKDWWE
ncbi:hypothetical protein DICPUDRAFT_158242 [Dictyostelium purpureum]|uniref:SH2 domain-containing protein n=1 Tax=Dictyostelium purpureum TaxID=5786 RepID=F1A158_DICPU|nr:uncharacterized protein DICPUDRAFT_158242 [Dictyostelium purpureum]EGC30073.1 hypothetical protein DICPUDRAFT_158242 [Dictyostelium purpureum]|eukprot:XP_003293403.1 hypothetical protein DICPUDRAFT_158242 [Dictyostelium purpureum]